MNIRPGECYVIDANGARCTERAYPLPSEAHSAADLLRPLAADNARLQDEVDRLTVTNEALRIALKRALERERERGRMPG